MDISQRIQQESAISENVLLQALGHCTALCNEMKSCIFILLTQVALHISLINYVELYYFLSYFSGCSGFAFETPEPTVSMLRLKSAQPGHPLSVG